MTLARHAAHTRDAETHLTICFHCTREPAATERIWRLGSGRWTTTWRSALNNAYMLTHSASTGASKKQESALRSLCEYTRSLSTALRLAHDPRSALLMHCAARTLMITASSQSLKAPFLTSGLRWFHHLRCAAGAGTTWRILAAALARYPQRQQRSCNAPKTARLATPALQGLVRAQFDASAARPANAAAFGHRQGIKRALGRTLIFSATTDHFCAPFIITRRRSCSSLRGARAVVSLCLRRRRGMLLPTTATLAATEPHSSGDQAPFLSTSDEQAGMATVTGTRLCAPELRRPGRGPPEAVAPHCARALARAKDVRSDSAPFRRRNNHSTRLPKHHGRTCAGTPTGRSMRPG